MKINLVRAALLTAAASVLLAIGSTGASAATYVDVRVGTAGPPPVRVEHQWARPYRGAVWIPGRYEWAGGSYVWYGGYYEYPSHRGAYWVPPRYIRHQDGAVFYRPGHWDY